MKKYFLSTLDTVPNRKYEILGTLVQEATANNVLRFVYNSVSLSNMDKAEIELFLRNYGADAMIGIKPAYKFVRDKIASIRREIIVAYMGTLIKFTDSIDDEEIEEKVTKNYKKVLFK